MLTVTSNASITQSPSTAQKSPVVIASAMDLAQAACSYARGIIKYSGTSSRSDHDCKGSNLILLMRSFRTSGSCLERNLAYATHAKEYEVGNCGEYSQLVVQYATTLSATDAIKCNLPADVYVKFAAIQNGDHGFVIISTDSEISDFFYDYNNNKDDVICDAWSGKCYYAKDVPCELKDFHITSAGNNSTMPFDPKRQYIIYEGTCVCVHKNGSWHDASYDASLKSNAPTGFNDNIFINRTLALVAQFAGNYPPLIYAAFIEKIRINAKYAANIRAFFAIPDLSFSIQRNIIDILLFSIGKSDAAAGALLLCDLSASSPFDSPLSNDKIRNLVHQCVQMGKPANSNSYIIDTLCSLLKDMQNVSILTEENIIEISSVVSKKGTNEIDVKKLESIADSVHTGSTSKNLTQEIFQDILKLVEQVQPMQPTTCSGITQLPPNTSTTMAKFGLFNGELDHKDTPTSASTSIAGNSKTDQTSTSSSSDASNFTYGDMPTYCI